MHVFFHCHSTNRYLLSNRKICARIFAQCQFKLASPPLSVCLSPCVPSNERKKDNSYIIIWYALFVCDPIYQIAYQRRIDRRNGEIKLIELNTSTKSSFEYRRENCSNRSFIMSIVKFPLILSLHRISQEEFKSFDSKENML